MCRVIDKKGNELFESDPVNETTRLLRDLVRLPSINPMGRDLPPEHLYEHRVTAYLESFFRDLGVPVERQAVAPLRENIIARCDLGGRRTYLFEVHQDTVPVDHMTIDPFGAVIDNGRLYGRGACDIKGGMAAMLTAFARLAKEKPAGAANVILACSVDEEHTFFGVQRMVKNGLRADGAIVAEPTSLRIVQAHKGAVRWHVTTPGRACHSSTPEQGINAIYRMGRLLTLIERYAERLRASRTDPLLGPPTLSVGCIEGGSSVNTIPDFCRIHVDRRLVPGEDSAAALAAFNDALRAEVDLPFDYSEPWIDLPSLPADAPPGKVEFVRRFGAFLDRALGRHECIAVPYGTDASTLSQAGIPALVFGPGDIAQAHTRDEWVDLAEVERAAELLFRFACEG
jgi:acetylornithine deacetylase